MLCRFLPLAFVGCVLACSASPEEIGNSSAAVTTVCGASPSGAVQGVDVSVYQGDFDWQSAGVQFGYARIGDGLGGDSQFASNWSKMKAAGVLRGAYQFFEPGDDETAQANLMIQAVGTLGDGDLPCMIDVEVTGGQSGATIAQKIAHWIQLVQAGTGRAPFIYTGPYFWQDSVGSTSFGSTPLWVADYGPSCPLIPPGWSNWTMWQYSDGNGALDHDVFNGSLADLQKFAAPPAPTYPIIVHRGATDINGDGSSDICARAAAGVVCEVSNKGGASTEVKGPAWSDASGWDKPEYYWTIQLADVDGDGKADLCARDPQGIVCEISNGQGFGAEIRGPNWGDSVGWSSVQYYSTIQFADVNGDGKMDVCARAAAGITCQLSNGTSFPTTITGPAWSDASNWNQPQYYNTIQFIDVDGDGKADVCGRSAAGVVCELSDGTSFSKGEVKGPAWRDAENWAAPEYESTIRYVDVDGNGKLDVCGRAAVGAVCYLFDGEAFTKQVTGPAWSDANGWNAPQYFTTIQFADIDGNGKADICGRSAAGIVCELSNGTGFPTEVIGPAWSTAGGWDDPQYNSTIGFADIDDDGKDDVCARGWAGMQCALSKGTSFAAAQAGVAWSDPEGWGVEQYYATVRYGGVKQPKVSSPNPGGGDGGANNPPSNENGGSNGISSGCAISPATFGSSTQNGVSLFALFALALVTRGRLRSPSRRCSSYKQDDPRNPNSHR